MESISNTLYTDSAKLGNLKSIFVLISAAIVAVILISISLMKFTSPNVYLPIKGTIVNTNCTNDTVNNKPAFNCILDVSYSIDNTKHKSTLVTNSSNAYENEQSIDIEYNKENLTDIRIPALSNTATGSILLSFAVLALAGAYLNYYLTTNYKLYASAQGAQTVYSIFR